MFEDYIKRKLRKLILWVLRDDLDRIDSRMLRDHSDLCRIGRESGKVRRLVEMTVGVGVDHHLQKEESWMVICTRNYSQYTKRWHNDRVNFYHIPDNNIKYVRKIVDNMGKENVIIDGNPVITKEFFIK